MGIETWEWEKSLHTVTSKHLQKTLIAFTSICDCLGFSVFFVRKSVFFSGGQHRHAAHILIFSGKQWSRIRTPLTKSENSK